MNSKPVTRQFEDSDLHQELVTFEVPKLMQERRETKPGLPVLSR